MERVYRFRIGADFRLVRAASFQAAQSMARHLFGPQIKHAIVAWFPNHATNGLTPHRAYDEWARTAPAYVSTAQSLRAAQKNRAQSWAWRNQENIRAKIDNAQDAIRAMLAGM